MKTLKTVLAALLLVGSVPADWLGTMAIRLTPQLHVDPVSRLPSALASRL